MHRAQRRELGASFVHWTGAPSGYFMCDVESVSLSWRVETRRFQLVAGRSGLPELTVDGELRLSLTAEEWCGLGDVLFRIGMDWPGAPGQARAIPGGAFVASEADAASRGRRGRPWTEDEETRLLAAYDAGDHASEVARALGRSRAGVMARLVKLGRVEESNADLRFPLQRGAGLPAAE